jgi:DNA-directed RNA polymerase subunit L
MITLKLSQMAGAAPDLSAATFQIFDESHTIGNALRWMIMKKYVVFFCLMNAELMMVLEVRRWSFVDIG